MGGESLLHIVPEYREQCFRLMAALPEIIHSRAHIAPEVLDLLNECMRNDVDKLLESEPEKTEDISEKADDISAELLRLREHLFKSCAGCESERRDIRIKYGSGIALMSLFFLFRVLVFGSFLHFGLRRRIGIRNYFVRLYHHVFVNGLFFVSDTARFFHGGSGALVESFLICCEDIVIIAVDIYLLKKLRILCSFIYSVFKLVPVLCGRL